MMQQASALAKRPHVLVSTPGRLVDHLRSSDVLDLSRIRYLVLDEADRLLDDSFGSEMECILGAVGHIFAGRLSGAPPGDWPSSLLVSQVIPSWVIVCFVILSLLMAMNVFSFICLYDFFRLSRYDCLGLYFHAF